MINKYDSTLTIQPIFDTRSNMDRLKEKMVEDDLYDRLIKSKKGSRENILLRTEADSKGVGY